MDPTAPITAPPLYKLHNSSYPNIYPAQKLGFWGLRHEVTIGLTNEYKKRYWYENLSEIDITGKAMIDTGSIASAVDSEVVTKLGVKSMDSTLLSTSAKGTKITEMYSLTMKFKGYYFDVFKMAEANLKPHNLIALIGRDILHLGSLQYTGPDAYWHFLIPGYAPPPD